MGAHSVVNCQKLGPRCPVTGCPRRKRMGHVMCARHWFTVPHSVRDRVWAEYKKKPGSPRHQAAVRAAIRAANEAED